MKYLIVYAHPNPKSFCHAILEKVQETIRQQGGEVNVRDLYQMGFNSVLAGSDFIEFSKHLTPADIKTEQDLIVSSDVIIFIHPVWWFSMPAILKGYVDRVFSYGFAYAKVGMNIKGLLPGKKAMIFSTTGGPWIAYLLAGYKAAIKTAIDGGIFKFCGMKVLLHKYFYAVPAITDSARKQMLASISKIKF